MKVRIEAPVVAKKNQRKITSRNLKKLDGLSADTPLSRYIDDGADTAAALSDVDVGGGTMRLEARSTGLVVISEFDCERKLEAPELRALLTYTRGQWLEGVGESFAAQIEQTHGVRLVIDLDRAKAQQARGPASRRQPLVAAVDAGNLEATRDRLAAGDDVEAKNRKGETVLQIAIMAKHDAVAAELVRSGAELVMEAYGHSMLWAARNGMVETVRAFLVRGVEPDLPANNGAVSLAAAINMNQLDAARVLLEGGADVDFSDTNAYTAAHYADTAETLELLLDYGARLDIPDRNGETVLDHIQRDAVVETHWRTGETKTITEGAEYERRVARNRELREVVARRDSTPAR